MDKLKAIEVFLAIARYGSLTQASVRLGRSLPAVVRTLATLERELGVRLFNRTTRRIALTEEGQAYLNTCTQLTGELSAVESRLRGDRRMPSGLVHVAASHLFGEMHVAPVVTALLRRHPDLRARLSLTDRITDLVDEDVDIAVRIGHIRDSSLVARQIGHVRQVLCASPDFLRQHGEPDDLAALSELPCLRIDGNNAGLTWPFREGDRLVRIPVSGQLVGNMVRPAIAACLDGLGLSLFLSYQVADHVQQGRLRVLLQNFEPEPLPVRLVYPHRTFLSTRVKVVLDALEQALGQRLRTVAAKMGDATPEDAHVDRAV